MLQTRGLGPPGLAELQAGDTGIAQGAVSDLLTATCFSLPSLISFRRRNLCLPGTVGGLPIPRSGGYHLMPPTSVMEPQTLRAGGLGLGERSS